MGVVAAMVETCENISRKISKAQKKKLTFAAHPLKPLNQDRDLDQRQDQDQRLRRRFTDYRSDA